MSWKDSLLGAHVDLISGPAFKSAYFTDDPTDMPLVKGENIGQGEILWSQSRYWPRPKVEEYARFKLKSGDVILAMDRPWVTAGLKYAWIKDGDPEALLVQRVARLRGTNGVRTDFIRYVVASKAFSDYIQAIMGGTNVPHISGEQIRAFKFRTPDADIQGRIIEVLSAYDDLIANNKRRIELLEQSARLLFREWFVRLKYPGHEHDRVIDGVPHGWLSGCITDLGDVLTGKTPSKQLEENFGKDVPFIKTPDMHGAIVVIETAESLSIRGAQTQPKKHIPPLSTMVSCIGSVGVVALNEHVAQTNQQINTIVPREEEYTFYHCCPANKRIDSIGYLLAQYRIWGRLREGLDLSAFSRRG